MKIAIIGNAGSGKSTLGLKLHKILNIPLYHLDQYFWKPNWQEPDRKEFEKIHNKLCDKSEWIIEGIATRFFDYRAAKADILIFLDVSPYKCLYRVTKRMLLYYGKVLPSSAKGCPERGFSWKFLTFIWNFDKTRKSTIEILLEKYKNKKKIFVIQNKKELEKMINALS